MGATAQCDSCAVVLSKRVRQKIAQGLPTSGLCMACYRSSSHVERKCVDCGKKLAKIGAKRCQLHANQLMARDAERERQRIETSRAAFYQPDVRARHNAANRQLGRRKTRWLPDEHRATYFKLLKRMSAADAKANILARLTPFERQLARVLDGKAVVTEKLVLPTREYGFTLGGVSAGMV